MEIVIKVNSTYNNTIVSALYKGKILKTISTGSLGFKKAKRSSTLAAQSCGEALGSWLLLLYKNVTLAQKARKTGVTSKSNLNLSKKLNSSYQTSTVALTSSVSDDYDDLEFSILQEAKKKLVTTRVSSANKVSKKKNNSEKLDKQLDVKDTSFSQSVDTKVSLLIAGVGYGKFGVIRGLSKLGIQIKTISDVTAVPHNGCKAPKMRRK